MIIYKITNLINNKIYIGQTHGLNSKYFGGGTILKKAIKKYNKENFKMEIIVQGNFNRNLINSLEIHYIRLYNSTNPKIGYNIQPGGSESLMSDYVKKKIGNANRYRKHTQQFKDKIREIQLNKPRKESTKTKISNSMLGVKKSKSHCENIKKAKEIKVYQYKNGTLIKEWNSILKAALEINGSAGNIHMCCSGIRKLHKGYNWSKNKLK